MHPIWTSCTQSNFSLWRKCCNPEICVAVEGDVHGKADRRKTISLYFSFSVSLFPSHCQPVVSLEFPRNKGRNKTVFLAPFIFHYHNDLGFVESFHVYLTVCMCLYLCVLNRVCRVFLSLHCRSPHSGAQRLKKRARRHTHSLRACTCGLHWLILSLREQSPF